MCLIQSNMCIIILSRIIKEWNLESHELLTLKSNSPTIYGIFIVVSQIKDDTKQEAINACSNVCKELLEKRNDIFNNDFENYPKPITQNDYERAIINSEPNITAPSLEILELYKTGCFFPGYPVRRTITDVDIEEEPSKCSKIYKQQRTMGPGTLYFFCVVHQKCIGFVILDKPESLRIVTQVLLTRFSKLPEYMIYDNGCNLHDYIINRYPNELANSRIFVDGFHFNSHKNCAHSYDSGSYPDLMQDINTSLAEQKNSRYSEMKLTSPFLKLSTFMAKVRFTCLFYNTK